jgi:hypothetical protein
MLKKEIIAITLSILLRLVSTGLADPAKGILKIDVEIKSDGANTTELVSYFCRALQGIGDIEITKEDPDIVIHCAVMPIKLQNGFLLGYAIGTAFTSSMNLRSFAFHAKLTPEQAAGISDMANGDEIFCNMTNTVTGPTWESVEGAVKRIVDSADGDIFQAEREQLRLIKNWPNRNARTQK